MCNIAGYVGERRAAPILIDMLRREEGLDAGYYTGIATIHEGRIYHAKLVGDLDRLLSKTNAATLPGNVGIIHGRTPGTDGDSWSHPFLGENENGDAVTALVLNGWIGCFEKNIDAYRAYADSLVAQGVHFTSRTEAEGSELRLSDGARVHLTDLLCQHATLRLRAGADTVTAAADTLGSKLPKEAVTLLLSLTEPNAITYARMNFPMFWARTSHGSYLATAPQAFPDDAGEPTLLPALSSGLVTKNGFTATAFPTPPATVAPLTARVLHDAYDAILRTLREEGEGIFNTLAPKAAACFDKADCKQVGACTYLVLDQLIREGRIKTEIRRVPGVFDGLTVPRFYMSPIE